MKLATLKSDNPKSRDGQLVIVSKDNTQALKADSNVSLLFALQNWTEWHPKLKALSEKVNSGGGFKLDIKDCLAPLPNAPGFFDGSAYLSHVARARAARGDTMPESAKVTPLMYQGVSDNNLGPYTDLEIIDESYGGDFEGEFAVVTTDVKKGSKGKQVESSVALLLFFNDITLREILKPEIERKFGFLQSKPNSAYAPFAVTPDEVGSAWNNGVLELAVQTQLNGEWFGNPDGSEMHFSFYKLIEHACFSRPLSAGTIIGSGTVSNQDKSKGFACLTEKRYQEVIETKKASTRWLKPGDLVEMDVLQNKTSVFGAIRQKVKL